MMHPFIPPGVLMDGRLTRGFRLRLRLRRDRPPLTRLHHRAILWRPAGLRIWLAALAVLGRDENGCRRGEECPLGMVKNLPAADGEEQLAL